MTGLFTFAVVKRFWSYAIFVSVLFYSTPMSQFLKLPMLLVHFIDHSERQPSITFADFLSMHYWGEDVNDSDYDEDMKLPFKSSSNLTHIVYCIGDESITLNIRPQFDVARNYPLPNSSSLPDKHLSALFRPPRAVVYAGC